MPPFGPVLGPRAFTGLGNSWLPDEQDTHDLNELLDRGLESVGMNKLQELRIQGQPRRRAKDRVARTASWATRSLPFVCPAGYCIGGEAVEAEEACTKIAL